MIVFNALQATLSGGIGRYCFELAKHMYLNNEKQIKIVIRQEDKFLFEFVDNNDLIVVSGINNSIKRNIYEQIQLPRLIYKRFPNAVIHYPDTMAPLLSKNKVVITIHDLAFKTLNRSFTLGTSIWKNIITDLSVRKANKIIAITNFTKGEILRYYPKIKKNKISVIYNGFNDFSKQAINEEKITNKIKKINKPYILTVSTISPRKNMDGLIKAFYNIKDKVKEDLVIAGSNGWMYEEVFKLVDELQLNERVIFTGKVNDDELKYLYKNAEVFAYVSFYEGFGLPPLEAMSYGIKSIVSNSSCIPEVVGECGIKVDPNDENMMGENLYYLLSSYDIDNSDIYRKNLSRFSWDKCSSDTFKLYNDLIK